MDEILYQHELIWADIILMWTELTMNCCNDMNWYGYCYTILNELSIALPKHGCYGN